MTIKKSALLQFTGSKSGANERCELILLKYELKQEAFTSAKFVCKGYNKAVNFISLRITICIGTPSALNIQLYTDLSFTKYIGSCRSQ